MAQVRLMGTPADFRRLGVSPGGVEPWEDQRRDDGRPGHWEWWYFDAILDDGTAVVIQFFTKSNATIGRDGDEPSFACKITLPDGTHREKIPHFSLDEASWDTGKADVHYGPNSFVGDLRNYRIRVDDADGLGADLEVASLASPYRPGTAYFGFDDDEHYYTWLCAVPKADVSGTITVDGKRIDVHGRGYHDHQWGNANLLTLWNHWLWARQSYDDYTMLVFDMVAQERYGYQRFPICFIQDADGKLVFENTHDVSYELLDSYVDEKTGKDYPRSSRYTFDHDGSHVVYTVTADKTLEVRDAYHEAPEEVQKLYDQARLHPSYSRYAATGDLELTDAGGAVERSAGLIYEFMYPGQSFREHI